MPGAVPAPPFASAVVSPAQGHIGVWNAAGRFVNQAPGVTGAALLSGGAGADPIWSHASGAKLGIGMIPSPAGGPQGSMFVGQSGGADIGQLALVDLANGDALAICGLEFLSNNYLTAGRLGGIGKLTSSSPNINIFSAGGIDFFTNCATAWSGVAESLTTHYVGDVDILGNWSFTNSANGAPATKSKLTVWGNDPAVHILSVRQSGTGINAGVAYMRIASYADLTQISWTGAGPGPELNFHTPSTGAVDFKLSRNGPGVLFLTGADLTIDTTKALKANTLHSAFGGEILVSDGEAFAFGTGSGTKFGTTTGQKLGFWGAAPVAKPAAVSGSRGGNVALAALLTALASIGLITDSTSA